MIDPGAVRHRPLGARTVTAIGSGDVRLGLAASRGLDSRDVTAGLHTALGLGLTIVDVGDEQDAERLAGDAVRAMRLRDSVIVATRVPLVPPLPGAPRRDLLSERLPPRYVQERVEATLRATHLDALALAQLPILPAWRESSAWPELAGMCARLVREGKVLAWGAIVDEVAGAEALVAEPWLVSLHVTFNACTREALPLIQAARTETARGETVHGQAAPRTVTILARQPLAGGALAGTLGPGVALVPRDDRRVLDEATLERIATAIAALSPLVRREPPAARSCDAAKAALERGVRPDDVELMTVAELALRFVLDHDVIALPRLHRREHVLEAIVACSAPPLSASLRARIDDILKPVIPVDSHADGRERSPEP